MQRMRADMDAMAQRLRRMEESGQQPIGDGGNGLSSMTVPVRDSGHVVDGVYPGPFRDDENELIMYDSDSASVRSEDRRLIDDDPIIPPLGHYDIPDVDGDDSEDVDGRQYES